MMIISYSDLRKNLKEYCAKAQGGEAIIATRKNGRHVVLLGLAQYDGLIKPAQGAAPPLVTLAQHPAAQMSPAEEL